MRDRTSTRVRYGLIALLGLMLLASASRAAQAQRIRLDVADEPLAAVLDELRTQASIDIVYAQRLVAEKTVSCQYAGSRAQAALDCVLDGTGLRARQVRRRQYVLVAAEDEPVPGPAARRERLAGYVTDAETGTVLPGAHIYLTGLQVGTTTNRAGYFVFPALPPGEYAARISFLGYAPVDTALTAGRTTLRISLEPTPLEADGLLVEGDLSRDERRRMPGMLSVELDQLNQMPSLGEQDLFQALRWTPGIRKSSLVNGGLSVRGGQPDQNLYLLDGAPIYHPWHAFSLVSTFQTGTLQSTNLYRSAFPAEHGGRLSAVLDAQMKDGNRSQPRAVAALSLISGRFRIESPVTPSVSFMLSGRRSYLDKLIGREHPVEDATGRRDTLRTGYYFYDASAKLTARPNAHHRFSLSYYRGRDDLDLRLPFDLSLDFSSWLRPADLFFEVQQNWENRVLSAQHQYLASSRLFFTTTAYRSSYQAEEGSFVQPTTTASLLSDYDVRLRDVGLKANADYYHSVAHEVRAGVQVSHQRFASRLDSDLQRSAGAVDTLRQESRLTALKLVGYVQDTWKPSPRWEVQPGVRVSYFSGGRYAHVRPRLNARYTVHPDHLVLRAGAGAYVQYLHRLRDRYSLAYDLVSSRWVPSGRSVRPATSWQLSFGAQSNPWSELTLELTAYGRVARRVLIPEDVYRTKDGIEGPGIEVGALRGQYVPTTERAWGGELSALYKHRAWQFQLDAASARSFVEAPPLESDGYRPADLDLPYSLRGAISWSKGHWETALTGEVRSGFPHTRPVARYELGDPTDEAPTTYLYRPRVNNGRLPTYGRIDAAVGYRFQWLTARWRAKLSVYNVTSRRNVVDRRYQPSGRGVAVDDRRGMPILPLVELEMTL